ncbi:MAG: aminotransferase class I/II-fold pyridoxal phosphate-dependent enzyme, partial [Eubacteriales bacterium]|nr:aminotransferase class I/II-fold pyridoxal phosphate-dependent enzyme [Eubacteriales bacterium]
MKKLYKELEKYGKSDFYPFHMPGHKRNPSCVDGEFLFERDITEISGFDDLHHPEGLLRDSMERLSDLYGTKESFFCVNGSTGALLSAISAGIQKGGRFLVARNCHKSVYHAIYLRDLSPIYLYPQTDPDLGINGGISPSHVEKCLEENKGIQGIMITSPTYDGVVSDIEAIAKLAHKYGIPLIVDEAHGPHFRFSPYFPTSAVDLGADVVVQSFHKTLPSLTQTAVLHLCSDRVDREKIKRFLGMYQTSSPSYLLMASLD